MDSTLIVAFNGKVRVERSIAHRFMSLDGDWPKMVNRRKHDNVFRPRSAIGNKPPISLMNCSGAFSQP